MIAACGQKGDLYLPVVSDELSNAVAEDASYDKSVVSDKESTLDKDNTSGKDSTLNQDSTPDNDLVHNKDKRYETKKNRKAQEHQ